MRGRRRPRFRIATSILGAVVLCGSLLAAHSHWRGGSKANRLADAPERILWAWERPEDLRFIDPSTTGVAFWAGTVGLRGSSVEVTPRGQVLVTPASTWRMAVVRMESDLSDRSVLDDRHRAQTLETILSLVVGDEDALQLDFDALASERDFYGRLIAELRDELDPAIPLTITALASWCLGDSWMSGLPIDEAVPMLFRMGRDAAEIRSFLERGGDFNLEECRGSYGLSTDEPTPALRPGRRIYFFHPESWSEPSTRAALAEIGLVGSQELGR